MKESEKFDTAIKRAIYMATQARAEYLCPEHLLLAFMQQPEFVEALVITGGADHRAFAEQLTNYLNTQEHVPDNVEYQLTGSVQFDQMMQEAASTSIHAEADVLDVPHVVNAMLHLRESQARHLLVKHLTCDLADFLGAVYENYSKQQDASMADVEEAWRAYVTCLSDEDDAAGPAFIGRQQELERTIQVMCRKQKHNVLHVGEPGVGKTALMRGLASRLRQGQVPARLKDHKVYEVDMGGIMAGAQFRGEMEKRLKAVMDGIEHEGEAIVYFDNIHVLIGAGQSGEGGMDATQILRPYMEREKLRFVGSTTHKELQKYLSKKQSFVLRFQQIDIDEPSESETVEILHGLLPQFEAYHGVKYDEGVVEYVVEASSRYIAERCQPDKAIDIIDEAGAYRELHPTTRLYRGKQVARKTQLVDRQLVDGILTRICKVNAEALASADNKRLASLADEMKAVIYGQDEAIDTVVRSVEMAKAGLTDDDKPMGSLLFVGPTGVGKTEVARTLAERLGIPLVRFDMSEYTEKHTVAKLIGSPAGYVGYDDGGLLTDAIRKTPNCVLLLDEIEKAHSDIYNILLQVMDYARLTDNKGNKADFRNVMLILTSNAGAQHAAQASVGFGGGITAGQAMLTQVKRIFKPEFLNRLSSTVVFHDMDRHMASLILDKKLRQLEKKLEKKHVALSLEEDARNWLLDKGFSRQYGAREMDRAIQHHLTPLLMQAILYGGLAQGGVARVALGDGEHLSVEIKG